MCVMCCVGTGVTAVTAVRLPASCAMRPVDKLSPSGCCPGTVRWFSAVGQVISRSVGTAGPTCNDEHGLLATGSAAREACGLS